jgi:hypothetical protein
VLVSSRPHNVIVREIEWRAFIAGFAALAENAVLGHGNIEHDLDVTRPVSGVSKYEDRVNLSVGKVASARVGMLFGCEFAEGSCGRVMLDNVARSNNILEPVSLSDEAALFTFAANNEYSSVLFSHLPHGSVAADELAWLNILIKLRGKVSASFFFSLATAIGQENVRTE